jgi:hypothetical protein
VSVPRHPRPARPALAALLAAAALGGCGDVREAEEGDRARAAVEAFLHVCSRGEGKAALEVLTDPAASEFLKGTSAVDGCQRILGVGVGEPGADLVSEGEEALKRDFEEARVSGVDLRGGFGTATVEIAGRSVEVELESKGDVWSLTKTRLTS